MSSVYDFSVLVGVGCVLGIILESAGSSNPADLHSDLFGNLDHYRPLLCAGKESALAV